MHVACTGVDLSTLVQRVGKTHQANVESSLAAIPGHLQHVVVFRLDTAPSDLPSALHKLLHEVAEVFRRLHRHRLPHGSWYRQIQHLWCADVRNEAEHAHQLWNVEEAAEPRLHAIATTVRSKLQGCDRLTKVRSPGIEVLDAKLFKHVCLQVAHHGPQLCHRVTDGRCRCQNKALAVSA